VRVQPRRRRRLESCDRRHVQHGAAAVAVGRRIMTTAAADLHMGGEGRI
jgi:hypothetical protein